MDCCAGVIRVERPEITDSRISGVSGRKVSIMGSILRYLDAINIQSLSYGRSLYPYEMMEVGISYVSRC